MPNPSHQIELRGVETHNLKCLDLDLPQRKLIVICGVSGSGKTSLALDTLYAEGQRRYIETFSAYTRQFLEKLEKPPAERISGLPPAVAVDRRGRSTSDRSTIGTATETADYLRLLFARIGVRRCPNCGAEVRPRTPQQITRLLQQLPPGSRWMIGFDVPPETPLADLVERGFVRGISAGTVARLSELAQPPEAILLDRLTADADEGRIRSSVDAALQAGDGRCAVWVDASISAAELAPNLLPPQTIDGAAWHTLGFASKLRCTRCGQTLLELEPRNFSFNSPLGACPACEGTGEALDWDWELIAPDPAKSIAQHGLAPWNQSPFDVDALVARFREEGQPIDKALVDFTAAERTSLLGALAGFFAEVQAGKFKGVAARTYLPKWKSLRPCAACDGARLRPEAIACEVGGKNIAAIGRLRIDQATRFFAELALSAEDQAVARTLLEQIRARLGYLDQVGLGYLSLDRTLHTLSGGEAQRVSLTSALGSNLVNMLYVLDEPTVGLHPHDVERLTSAVRGLRDRGNTVVLVEHEEALLRAADQLVEIGPTAGARGGKVTFQGTLDEMLRGPCMTGDFLAGRRGVSEPNRRPITRGRIKLVGARGRNLKRISVEFPLGVLCLVTGVSGSGKSSLVQDTLYGALCRRKRKDCDKPLPYDDVVGDGQIDDVVLVDQEPIGRSPRSNPVTYIKAFDPIRNVFAESTEARMRNYTAGHFSFNVEGGRCNACEGEGYVRIDMQFLADVFMKCPTCNGTRYRKEILAAQYRGKSIAEVLEMSVQEAFVFFRGQAKVQARLKPLLDVGLDYLRLGQPANTLSSGEAQRLKLATYLTEVTRSRTLFILDEPTTGLHFADVVQLLDCFDALVNVGHSLIIVDHNLQLIRAADHVIDLGPGAGEDGGRVVAQGTPEQVAEIAESKTGAALRAVFAANPA